MHQTVELYKSYGHSPQQYYGKWPFKRFLGLQEPASVLFSILNGLAHYFGYKKMKLLPNSTNPLKKYYVFCGILGINLWIWSTLFHSRDFPSTEKGDYFSAILYLIYIFYLALIRVFSIDLEESRKYIWNCLAVYFIFHVIYLSFWPFDYSYNMLIGILFGLSANLMWIYHWIRKRYVRRYAWKQALLSIAITLCMSMELLDFPPIWGTFDAHSLWHASTVPLIILHYSFLDDDARFEVRMKKGKLENSVFL